MLLILYGSTVPLITVTLVHRGHSVTVTLVDRGHSVTVTVVVKMSTKGRLVTDTVSLYGFLNVQCSA